MPLIGVRNKVLSEEQSVYVLVTGAFVAFTSRTLNFVTQRLDWFPFFEFQQNLMLNSSAIFLLLLH